ncbi:hypothetical protein N9971_00075 [bacterium]|nr:hypothetical protein [bacterium]
MAFNAVFDTSVAASPLAELIYNHGYSGFSSVHQSVFVELASRGYIVISVGHENESSLLVVNDEVIIKTDPHNESTRLWATGFMPSSQADCYQATIRGFSHGSFTDVTFFNEYLKDMDVDLTGLEARFPEMTLSRNSN